MASAKPPELSPEFIAVFIAVFWRESGHRPPWLSPWFSGVFCGVFVYFAEARVLPVPRSCRNRQRSVSPRPYPAWPLFVRNPAKPPPFLGRVWVRPPGPVARLRTQQSSTWGRCNLAFCWRCKPSGAAANVRFCQVVTLRFVTRAPLQTLAFVNQAHRCK